MESEESKINPYVLTYMIKWKVVSLTEEIDEKKIV